MLKHVGFKSEFSSSYLASVAVQPDKCHAWSETQIIGFLMRRLINARNKIPHKLKHCTAFLPVLSVPSDNGFGLALGSEGFGDDQKDAGDGVVVGNVGGRQWT